MRAALGAIMSDEAFGLVLASVVAGVLWWIFWRKGKSD